MLPVLMVAYYFPPAGGAGVQRTLKFVRYLPGLGWQPHLLVPGNADYPVLDPTLEREIPPEAVIHRTRIIEPYELYRRLTGRRGAGSLDVATASRSAEESARRSERLAEWIRATFFIPDARIGWLPFAVRAGRRIARDAGPRLIYTSAPPYTCHLVGLRLHRRTGLPWVADFRDSWVDWLSTPRRRGLSRRIDRRLEGSVLEHATRLVAVSRGVADDLRGRHPGSDGDRWRIIPNGFDPEDLVGVDADRGGIAADRLLITYSGTLYGPRDPETLVAALEHLAGSDPERFADFRIRFVGRVAESIRRRIEAGPAAGAFDFTGYVDHRRAIALARGSDVLMLIVDQVPQGPGILTGKLFEYLGLGRPILALAGDGEAVEVIRSCRAGWQVKPGDVAEMTRRLTRLRDAWRAGELHGPGADAVRPYQRQAQAAALSRVFDEIAGGAG